jgi:ketosteroid isomerase-like protein
MKKLALLLLVSSVMRPLAAQRVDKEVVAARDTVWRAYFHNDTALLRRYIPPAAATFEGAAQPRWNTRGDIMAGSRAFAESKAQFVDVKFANTQISASGHTALVRSNYEVIVESGGRRDTTRGRATELFVRQGKTWVNPYWQLEQGALADYDALLGTWEFRFQSRRPDGGFWPVFTGHWTFEKRPGGGLIEDRWRPDDPSTPMAQSLYTSRTFDPKRKVWQMIGSSSVGGEIEPGLTWADDTSRYAIQRNHGVLSRIRYLSIGANAFLWRSDVSQDGGKTWLLDAGTMEARRIAK